MKTVHVVDVELKKPQDALEFGHLTEEWHNRFRPNDRSS